VTQKQREFIEDHCDNSLNFKDNEHVIKVSDIKKFFAESEDHKNCNKQGNTIDEKNVNASKMMGIIK